jgi:hypothetical protein
LWHATTEKERDMPSKKPLRSTQLVQLRIPPDVAALLQHNARAMGFTLSDYASALIKGVPPVVRPSAQNQDVALAQNRVARAINSLATEEVDLTKTLQLLCEARNFLYAELLRELPVYNKAVVDQGKDEAWGDLDGIAA